MFVQAGVKVKKAREAYKTFVEKYASTKTEFEQKMEETAQVCMSVYVRFFLTNGLKLWSFELEPSKSDTDTPQRMCFSPLLTR